MHVMLLLDNIVCLENFGNLQIHLENFCVVKTSYPQQLETLLSYTVKVRHIPSLFCPAVSLEIKGEKFPADLIVLGTQGIDVILGMNWLAKYHGQIGRAHV